MKRIGLIGGLSPESTIHYYEIICREYNRKFGELNFPEICLRSINLQRLIPLFQKNAWSEVGEILLAALRDLADSGAEFAAILANTPHNAYERIREESPLKILTIMEATSEALSRDGRRTVALLGTRPTMEFGFFPDHFRGRGIESLVPNEAERKELDRIIWEELSHGEVREESRAAAREMIGQLVEQGAEAVILGCTELSMLIRPEDSVKPLYDTTRIHAEAILEFAIATS